MTRAEQRRAARAEKKGQVTYNLTQAQLDAIIKEKIFSEMQKMKKEATEDAINTAMTLMFVLPMEVLMDHFWPKSYEKQIPKFANLLTDYYYKWQIGELDMDAMVEDLEKYAGIKFVEEKVE